MRRRRIPIEERAYIDVVPLVDTLLAVFLFLALLALQSPVSFLSVVLPTASTGEKSSLSTLNVEVLKDGSYIFNNKIVSLQELESIISGKVYNSILIMADENAPHGSVVALMDIARKHQIENLLVGTRKAR
ncbi:MAG: biopolymer transporter ExbD [Aquificaceae bacterium]